jgi:hypothetical protein
MEKSINRWEGGKNESEKSERNENGPINYNKRENFHKVEH